MLCVAVPVRLPASVRARRAASAEAPRRAGEAAVSRVRELQPRVLPG